MKLGWVALHAANIDLQVPYGGHLTFTREFSPRLVRRGRESHSTRRLFISRSTCSLSSRRRLTTSICRLGASCRTKGSSIAGSVDVFRLEQQRGCVASCSSLCRTNSRSASDRGCSYTAVSRPVRRSSTKRPAAANALTSSRSFAP